jgi:glycosyl transferase family 1
VFVHPSLTEAFGVAAIEAQAMGLPVVCSDAGGLPENVEHGVRGFVVPRRDGAAIAERLAELVADPVLRLGMGRAARQRVERTLSIERQLDGFEALYEELLNRPRPEPRGAAATGEARAERLRDELDALDARCEALREQLWRRKVVDDVRAFVKRELPFGSYVLVVSRGDEELVSFPAHRGGHFPQVAGGAYAGHHPADSSEAIAHLAALREAGAEYLIVPATSGWWLEHYEELARHLEDDHLRIASEDGSYVAFAIGAAKAVTA